MHRRIFFPEQPANGKAEWIKYLKDVARVITGEFEYVTANIAADSQQSFHVNTVPSTWTIHKEFEDSTASFFYGVCLKAPLPY